MVAQLSLDMLLLVLSFCNGDDVNILPPLSIVDHAIYQSSHTNRKRISALKHPPFNTSKRKERKKKKQKSSRRVGATPSVAATACRPRVLAPEGSGISCGGTTSEDGARVGGKLSLLGELRDLEKQEEKWSRKVGAIVAKTRTGEGYTLPCGNQRSCLPDAVYNGLLNQGFEGASLPKLRKLSMPELGNDRDASWKSIAETLVTLGYPFKLVEVTSQFNGSGGTMLNLLKAEPGTFLVNVCVTVEEKKNAHCVMLSTIPEGNAPFGKLVDNHRAMKPVKLEEKDRRNKDMAKKAWRLFVGQNPSTSDREFTITPSEVYELVRG